MIKIYHDGYIVPVDNDIFYEMRPFHEFDLTEPIYDMATAHTDLYTNNFKPFVSRYAI